MKKVILALLAFTVLCLALWGCSPEESGEMQTEQTQSTAAQTDGDESSETSEMVETTQTEKSDTDGDGWIPGFYQ